MKRLFSFAPFIALGIGTVLAYTLFTNANDSRLALGSYEVADHIDSLYARAAPPQLAPSNDTLSSFHRAIAIAAGFGSASSTTIEAVAEDPDLCIKAIREGRNLYCYNVCLAAIAELQDSGIASRLWELNGDDGLGGNGHNLIEVFDDSLDRWVALDPFYRCYFTLDSTTRLSVAELRSSLAVSPERVLVRSFREGGRDLAEVKSEIGSLIGSVGLYMNNDFRWRYRNRYGSLSFLGGFFDQLPETTQRALRALLLGSLDTKLLYVNGMEDRYDVANARLRFYACAGLLSLPVIPIARRTLRQRKLRRARRARF